MARITTKKFLIVLLTLSFATASCTLKKHEQKKGGEPPAPVGAQPPAGGTPGPFGSPVPQIPFSGVPGKIDPQIQVDFDEYNNPSLSDDIEEGTDGENQKVGKKRFTGHTNDSDYAYTDSSTDFLINYLRTLQNANVDSHEKQLSLDFSQRIRSVKLLKTAGPEISIQLRYEVTKNRMTTVVLSGKARLGGRYASIEEKEKNPIRRIPGPPPVAPKPNPRPHPSKPNPLPPSPQASGTPRPDQQQNPKVPSQDSPKEDFDSPGKVPPIRNWGPNLVGELRCVDLHMRDRCATYLLSLVLRQNDGEAKADIIIRRSRSALTINPPQIQSRDPRVRTLKEIFYNSSLRIPHGLHFYAVEMQSFAVVNGRSEFLIKMAGDQGENLYFSGPLLTAFGSEPMELLLRRNPEFFGDSNHQWARMNSGSISSMIDSATLVMNNGRGGLFINLTVSERGTQRPIIFGLSFTRNTTPVLDLTQDSIFFNP